jgi:hypothetical protein
MEERAVGAILASNVSDRVKALIEHNDGGDERAAARALGLDPDCLAGLLSGDWERFSLDALAALVRGYGVSPGWLLSSRSRPR